MGTYLPYMVVFILFMELSSAVTHDRTGTGLTEIPNDIPLDVGKLILNDNSITYIAVNQFENYTSLGQLFINNNGFLDFPVFNSTTITMLHMRSCPFETLPSYAFAGIPNLYELSLNSGSIKVVEAFAFFGVSTKVSLNRNDISEIHDLAFYGSTGISYMDVGFNRIKTLSWLYHVRKTVSYLALSTNDIQTVPNDAFVGFEKVRNLGLASNKLTTWPNIAPLNSTLEILGVYRNDLKTIPHDAFYGFTQLNRINVGENEITNFPDLRPLRQSLNWFNIQQNKVSCVPGMYVENLTALSEAHLSTNLLKDFPFQEMLSSPSLTKLSLYNNEFTTLHKEDFVRSNELSSVVINLNQNPFTCDCNLAWIRSPNTTSLPMTLQYSNAPCSKPDSLVNVQLSTLEVSAMVCIPTEEEVIAYKYSTRMLGNKGKGFLGTPFQITLEKNEIYCLRQCKSAPKCTQFETQVQGPFYKCELFDARQCQAFEDIPNSGNVLYHVIKE